MKSLAAAKPTKWRWGYTSIFYHLSLFLENNYICILKFHDIFHITKPLFSFLFYVLKFIYNFKLFSFATALTRPFGGGLGAAAAVCKSLENRNFYIHMAATAPYFFYPFQA